MSNQPESSIFSVRPNSSGVLIQFRFVFHLIIVFGLLYPPFQYFILKIIGSYIHLTPDVLMVINSAPSIIVLLHALYLYAYETTKEYALTSERLVVRYGIFNRIEDEVELYRVVDVTQSVGLLQRVIGVGDVVVTSTDRTGTVVLPAIKSTTEIRNKIRAAAEICKNNRGALRILG